MFTKGSELADRFPEVYLLAEQIKQSSSHPINTLSFVRKANTPGGNFFRYKGTLTQAQLAQLGRIHNMPRVGSRGVTSRVVNGWTEFYTKEPANYLQLEEVDYFDHDVRLNEVIGREDNDYTLVYVNGRAITTARDWEYLNAGDTVVMISDNHEEEWGSVRKFEKMPTLKVYEEVLSGPYSHANSEGLWPCKVVDEDDIKRTWRLGDRDEVICPDCKRPNCDDHIMHRRTKMLVRRHAARPKLLYTIQSPVLLGDDASDQLRHFARVVIGREVHGNLWPDEVLKLEIADRDETGSTCGVTVDAEDTIEVTLLDRRIR